MLANTLSLAKVASIIAVAACGTTAFAAGEHGHHHHHEMRAVPAEAMAPTIALEVSADTMDGVNLYLDIAHFTFSPAMTGMESEAIEGHAHLYVNGEKIGRLYGTWAHLPGKLFTEGENMIRVSLNDNMHRAWAAEETAIEAMVTFTWPMEADAMAMPTSHSGHDHSSHGHGDHASKSTN